MQALGCSPKLCRRSVDVRVFIFIVMSDLAVIAMPNTAGRVCWPTHEQGCLFVTAALTVTLPVADTAGSVRCPNVPNNLSAQIRLWARTAWQI